jgi:hypothetical protein
MWSPSGSVERYTVYESSGAAAVRSIDIVFSKRGEMSEAALDCPPAGNWELQLQGVLVR